MAILVAGGVFWAGWSYRERKYNQELNALFKPAQQMSDYLIEQDVASAYKLMSADYRAANDQAKFKSDVASAITKDSRQNSLSVYTGADEGISTFDIANKDGTQEISLVVTTVKQDGEWTISYAQLLKK